MCRPLYTAMRYNTTCKPAIQTTMCIMAITREKVRDAFSRRKISTKWLHVWKISTAENIEMVVLTTS